VAIITRLERKPRHWVQVWQGDAEPLANIVAGRLQSEGIRARVHGHETPYRTAAMVMGGTWAIFVPASSALLARDMLRDSDEGHNVIDDEGAEALRSNQRATVRFLLVAAAGVATFFAIAWLRGVG
jgi:hypothetical protein